jgi:hypothetical protein
MHAPLISLPYFWDEAGYYVPAAADFLAGGALIPETVPTNAHPPLLSIYVSAWWKAFGQQVTTARIGMLAISVVGLWAVFRLGRTLHSTKMGVLALVCTAVYPCYFAQSSMVLADLPAAAFSLLALSYYFQKRRIAGVFFSIAVLFKETAVIVPLTLVSVDAFFWRVHRRSRNRICSDLPNHFYWTAVPVALLAGWYIFHWMATGVVFGNREFFRYNITESLKPSRFVLAFAIRCWQAFGHLGLLVFTVAAATSVFRAIRKRRRLALPGSASIRLGALVCTHLVAMSLIGGALLTRYLLPVVPLIILLALLVVRRPGLLTIAAFAVCSVNLVSELPYHYAVEENLAYRNFVIVHQAAAASLQREFPEASVTTAWPATFELTIPVLGYVATPLEVVPVDRPGIEEFRSLQREARGSDLILVFNREYSPPDSWLRPRRLLVRLSVWRRSDTWFGTPEGDTPESVAKALELVVLRSWQRGPFYAALLGKRVARTNTVP